MSRKFITDREIAFINKINHEYIQSVIGQTVYYYAISIPETQVNDIYNEAMQKTWSPPVEINGLVLWENPTSSTTQFGVDADYRLEVYFHSQELQERNVFPREGDFIEFGEVYFEISSITEPQIVFGQINNKIMKKCSCVKAREGQFKAGGRSGEGVGNEHPVEQVIHVNR